MYAVSLHQPWAAAVALGWKQVETRGHNTKLRGWFAIQAAKKWSPVDRATAVRLAAEIGKPPEYFNDDRARDPSDRCPANQRGAVVCIARLTRTERMTEKLIARQSEVELKFGNWEVGRYAWFLENVTPLNDPLPLRGQQGLWTLSPGVEAVIRHRAGL